MNQIALHQKEMPISHFIQQNQRGHATLWQSAVVMLGLAVVCVLISQFDARLINGVSVWEKPAKFFLSIAVQFSTVAYALGFIARQRATGIAAAILLWCGWAEIIYITYRASLGEASHFNEASTAARIAYAFMGVAAVSMTAASGFIGWRVWLAKGASFLQRACGLGLVLGAVLGTLSGAAISIHGSHWVGGTLNDAQGLGFFAWSTTGGDLRIAHFLGLHASQIIPLAALAERRWVVYAVAALISLATLFAYVGAWLGHPLFSLA